MKIGVYSIALNEASFVERWYVSAQEADFVVIADTGSTDDTIAQAQRFGINIVPISVVPWRFDVAKNMALDLVPKTCDVVVSLDMDEVLLPGWRDKLEASWQHDATILNHRYRNNANPWQWHSKVHNRHHCRWTGAVHETLSWSIPEKHLWNADIYLDEQQDTQKSRANYIELLHLKIDEGDRDWKTFYFLANEYATRGDLASAIEQRTHAYNLCTDSPVSKSYVAKNIANNCLQMGNSAEAETWFTRSVQGSNERESWYAYTRYLYQIGQWEQCLDAAQRCLEVQQRRDGYTYDVHAWSEAPYDLAAISAYNVGRYDLALEYGLVAANMAPNDERIARNLAYYKERAVTQ
jgi:glycosyltransferase involved in cell wall biosynthesis